MIRGVSKVVVRVDDQEEAREFWTTRVGFTVTRDEAYGDERWLEVTPPDGGPVLVLSPRSPDEPRREVRDELPHSPVFFTCDDLPETYKELTARGVNFPASPVEQPWGWWSMFEDQDGTRYALEQDS